MTAASFAGSKLTLGVSGPTSGMGLEINGRVVSPPRVIKVKASGKKLMVKGGLEQLALQPGANRIRVKNVYGWSNIFILNI